MLRGRREERGFTREEAAAILGICPSAYRSWESDPNAMEREATVEFLRMTDISFVAEGYFHRHSLLAGFFSELFADEDAVLDSSPPKADYLLPMRVLVRKRRTALGLSEGAVAAQVGVTEAAVRALEEEERLDGWTVAEVRALAGLLSVPALVLLDEHAGPAYRMIRERDEELGFEGTDLAEAVGLTPGALYDVENMPIEVLSLEVGELRRLLSLLHLDMVELFGVHPVPAAETESRWLGTPGDLIRRCREPASIDSVCRT